MTKYVSRLGAACILARQHMPHAANAVAPGATSDAKPGASSAGLLCAKACNTAARA